jgi:transposase
MPITKEIEVEIIRLHRAEAWLRGTIAKHLGVHHSVVSRVLSRDGVMPVPRRGRRSNVEPYIPFIKQALEKFPKLNATRLHRMVRERGYGGGIDHFRDVVRALRPVPRGEAYLRLTTLPGEQAQVDWGYFGKIKVGEAEHRLLAFVMVLSWSRRIFLRFYYGDATANFLRGHVAAFEHFERAAREVLYDNLKSAVIERVDSAIRFNSELLSLAAHYRFAPKPVPVARPTSKGKIERTVQYVRTAFFAGREFRNIDDLNEQAERWCQQEAEERMCPGDRKKTVAQAFEEEKNLMLELPKNPLPVYERKVVQVGKTPYVRFHLNDYSIPHQYVRRTLLVEATLENVRVVDGIKVIAEHKRSFDKGKLIECDHHIKALELEKKGASRVRGMDRILNVAPSSRTYFKLAAERGHNMGRLTQLLIKWLELYGAAELEAALHECLLSAAVHSKAIEQTLERRRQERGLPPPIALKFLKDRRIDEVIVQPKSLDTYDRLQKLQETDE